MSRIFLRLGVPSVAILAVAITTGYYLVTVSAKHESKSNGAQTLTLGRLAFGRRVNTASGQQAHVVTSNPDGTAQFTVASFPPAIDPTWSPNGTRIAYSLGGADIVAVNADGTGLVNLTASQNALERNPDWSSTGKIAYERGPGDGTDQIWVMNDTGANQTPFPGITQPTPHSPSWSPDGTKLAFVSAGEIWKINADGTGEQRVTTNATVDADPAWAPDGTTIIFAKGGTGIATINADGTNEVPKTNNPADTEPAWSPDGTLIAFRRASPDAGLWVMNAAGGDQIRIVADQPGPLGTFNVEPAWQPVAQTPNTFTISGRITRDGLGLAGVVVNLTGTTSAFATTDNVGNYQISGLIPGGNYSVSPSAIGHYFSPPNRSFINLTSNQTASFTALAVCLGANCVRNGKIAFVRDADIWSMNSDGTNQTRIQVGGASPNYSPDGSHIAFQTNRDGNTEIYRMNADGSDPVRLTNNPASDTSPHYSPDGRSIIFVSSRDGNNEIYRMNADGTNQVRLTNDAAQQSSPAFSPDGQKIIFVTILPAPMKLWRMNADGTDPQTFPDNGQGSNFYNRPSYSPDGSKIIFVFGNDITTQNNWTMNADGTNRVQFPAGRSSPTYSPDGTKVAYRCCFSGGFSDGIWTVNSDANVDSQRRLTNQLVDDFPDWQPLLGTRRTQFDFDGDSKSDPAIFRPASGDWWYLSSVDGAHRAVPNWGRSSDVLTPADYDGDLKTDFAFWRPGNTSFYVLNSFDSTFRIENFGLAGDIPTGGDFDGDGKADVAVYRPGSQSVLYYRGTMGNPQGNITFVPWGVSGDRPVVGDYDGDGKSDAAVFRPSTGIWYARQSSTGQMFAVQFGLSTDRVTPADYDADGKTDAAVFRDGIWYLLRSTQGFAAFQFGLAGDLPAPADYDGDGRADPAILRNGVWWILKSQSGAEAIPFGQTGDTPIQGVFVR